MTRSRSWWSASLAAAMLASGAAGALALGDTVQVHGFLSQGFALTDHNDLFGNSDDGGSFDLRDVGLNVSWQPRPTLRLAVQGVARWAGEADNGKAELDHGLLDWAPLQGTMQGTSWRAGVRAGRIKPPYGLYNQTRDVPHTRPTILLPAVYFETVRPLVVTLDGGGLYADAAGRLGTFGFESVAGDVRADQLQELPLFGTGIEDGDSRTSWIAQLRYEDPTGQLAGAFTAGDIAFALDVLIPPLPPSTAALRTDLYGAALEWRRGPLELTGEHFWRRIEIRSDLGGDPFWSPAYYLQALWQFAARWQAVLRYEAAFLDRDDKNGHALEAGSGVPAHQAFTRAWVAGLRYDPTPSAMLRAEVHHVDGTFDLLVSENPDPGALERRWNALLLQASYRF
jgi:hypothetical protein